MIWTYAGRRLARRSVLRRLAQDATDRGGSRVASALREPQQGEPGLRLPAEAARFLVRVLRGIQLSAQPVDVALQIGRLRRGSGVHRALEAHARALRLLDRGRPRTVQLHDLGAVDHAPPGERHQVGLPVAPLLQRRGPFLRAAKVVDLLARRDHTAVHDPGHDRRQLAGCGRDHRLVEEAEPLPHATRLDQPAALAVHREREEIAIAEALADLHRSGSGRGRALEVAGRVVLEGDRHQEIAALDAVLGHLIDQALCAAEPSRSRAHLAAKREVHADPEGAIRGTSELTVVETSVMSALEKHEELFVAPEQIRRLREQLEVRGPQRCSPICSLERFECSRPCFVRVELAAAFEIGVRGRHGGSRSSRGR